MSLPSVFVLVSLAATAYAASTGRIVGGRDTTIDNYPSLVQVENRFIIVWFQNCGGNILTTRYILSAAHCFTGETYSPSNRRIRAGSSYRNTGGIVIGVKRSINHPSYIDYQYDGDISVVELETPLVYSSVIQQASIIAPGAEIRDNMPAVYAGWGSIEENGPSSRVLQHVNVFTINRNICRQRYSEEAITDNMICAGVLDEGGRDACQGDSGGPMYVQNILVGIISWGYGCGSPSFPGVNTAVSSYTDWIVKTAV
uniref:trypsin n=1 Tax=Diatraea saccharalis TaxID=40085 RepID=A0A0M4M544_9NEOP|nr:trypsin-like serine protease precursor [Diatraea saccharalis]